MHLSSEVETRQAIHDYFKIRYRRNDEIDYVHDPRATMELIRELIDENGGAVRLYHSGIGTCACSVEGVGKPAFIGTANTWGRAVANAFVHFIDARCEAKK